MKNIFSYHPLPWKIEGIHLKDANNQTIYKTFRYLKYKSDNTGHKSDINQLLMEAANSYQQQFEVVPSVGKVYVIKDSNGVYLSNPKTDKWVNTAAKARIFRRKCDATRCINHNYKFGNVSIDKVEIY